MLYEFTPTRNLVMRSEREKGELSLGVRPLKRPAFAGPGTPLNGARSLCQLVIRFNRREIRGLRSHRLHPLLLPQLVLPQQQEQRLHHHQQQLEQQQAQRRQ